MSFDSVAEVYERSRPLYAPAALDWIAERLPLRRVLDLAAGTGKLTRQLVERGADVVAVEPGEEMRAVFARVLPGVELLPGAAEEIPLPDVSVDAVTVAQAFHWFDRERALPELHRVLRPGGGVALLWNQWDDDDPLMHELNEVVHALRPPWSSQNSSNALESSPYFANREERTFRHAEEVAAAIVVDRVWSVSAVVNATPEERERAFADVRRIVGDGTVPFRLITTVVAADRV